MRYLLDTHAFLWFFSGSDNLSGKAKTEIGNPNHKVYISIASIWEIAIKMSLGKLQLDFRLDQLKTEIFKNQIGILPLHFDHIISLTDLEHLHKDPFDRILICQAKGEKLTIISRDKHFKRYKKVRICW